MGLPRRGDLGSLFLPLRPFLAFLGATLVFAGAGWSSTRITTGAAVVGSMVVVGSVLVVSNSSNMFSILPSRTSISCVSRNCFANLEIVLFRFRFKPYKIQ